jgi:hypothetical protein
MAIEVDFACAHGFERAFLSERTDMDVTEDRSAEQHRDDAMPASALPTLPRDNVPAAASVPAESPEWHRKSRRLRS